MAKRKQPAPKPPLIARKQLDMPATYKADGSRMATLRELIDPHVPTLALSQLNLTRLAEIVAKRIELQPKFELMMVGAGTIGKDRAIAEVRAQTPVGRILMEIEQRAIQMLAENALRIGPATKASTKARRTKKNLKLHQKVAAQAKSTAEKGTQVAASPARAESRPADARQSSPPRSVQYLSNRWFQTGFRPPASWCSDC